MFDFLKELLDSTADDITESILAGQRRHNYFHDVMTGRIPPDASRNFAYEDNPKVVSRYDVLHRAILSVYESGAHVDVVTVANELLKRGELRRLGGLTGLHAFVDVK